MTDVFKMSYTPPGNDPRTDRERTLAAGYEAGRLTVEEASVTDDHAAYHLVAIEGLVQIHPSGLFTVCEFDEAGKLIGKETYPPQRVCKFVKDL